MSPASRLPAGALPLLALLLLAPAPIRADVPDTGDGPLPPVQGHLGLEVYSFPFPDDNIVERYVDGYLANRRDWLQVVLARSRAFRPLIEGMLQDRGMPRELAFLPAVESGFEPRATSPRGAAGLWQLMRNTAGPLGLRMDDWLDERRDVYLATDASLKKLAENERVFGDWFLALAAYNCGSGRLAAIMKRSPGSDYWALRSKGLLPPETAAFVPQFLALTRILSYPGRYGLDVDWDPAPQWARIPLDASVDLRVLSRAAGVPLDALTAANPELRFAITPPPSYHYSLKVPAEFAPAVRQVLSSDTMPLMEFRVHVIAAGDTLIAVARRYGVSVPMIQQFNPGVHPERLRPGRSLLVPAPAGRSG